MSKNTKKPAAKTVKLDTTAGKKKTNKTPDKKAAQKATQALKKSNKQSELRNELKELSGVEARRDMIRLAAAGLLLLVTIFLLLAFVSNIFTGAADQSGVITHEPFAAHNKGGYFGAIVSYYFMNQLFGFGALLIPVFLACVVFKLMMREACQLRLAMVFIHCVLVMVLISIDATYIQNNFLPESWCNLFGFQLGGMHGHHIVGTLESYVGSTTTFVILLILTIAYIGYWFTQVFIWIFKGFHKVGTLVLPSEKEEEGSDVPTEDTDAGTPTEDTDAEDGTTESTPTAPSDAAASIQPALNAGTPTEYTPEDDTIPDVADALTGTPQDNQPLIIDLDPHVPADLEPIEDLNGNPIGTTSASATTIGLRPSDIADTSSLLPPTSGTSSAPALDVNATKEEQKAGTKTAVSAEPTLLPYNPKLDLERYKYPPISLLTKHTSSGSPTTKEELEANKNRIIEVLRNFSVEISKISATVGPTVTLYEITPAPGVRIAKIRNLEDDIALSLSALGIRIIAPIPGKGTIGIEVPNASPQVVSMESIVNTQKFRETKYELPIALGKTITNEMFMVDLAKMPHLLVAGATGQGKSVGLNAIITSLLYKKHPSELKIVMIDPKKVEFSMYNPIINHFLAQVPDSDEPVVTDVKKVINTLKSLCQEMDDRYDLLKTARCRNIKEYNAKFCERHLLPSEGHHYLPYIVVIIDEFGDLIMTAGKEIELPIARIAQLARAVGIHMVIATQSPRATIITGKIKANFPARMAFRVSQGIESQTILDRRGANNLIGKGDMLFQAGSELTRVQCAFVDTPEVVAIAKYIESQQAYPSPFELPLVAESEGDGMEGVSSQDGRSTFEQVASFVVNTQSGSTSKIQRQFSVGFNRAGRLMDQLEEAGIVGPQMGSKPRQVLVQSEIELLQILANLKENGINFE